MKQACRFWNNDKTEWISKKHKYDNFLQNKYLLNDLIENENNIEEWETIYDDNINIDELNKNINKLEIDQKITEFDKELYQRPTDEVFIRGLEILIYYDKIGNNQKFDSFFY